ncbi:MAG: hypothetical protein ACK5II_02430 [Paracoccus sp. (in: a-proteobacteria)]
MEFMDTQPQATIRPHSTDDLGCGWSALHMLTSLSLSNGHAERNARALDELHDAVVLPFYPSAA